MAPEVVLGEEEVVTDETLAVPCHMEWALPDLVTKCLPPTCTRQCRTAVDILLPSKVTVLLKVWKYWKLKSVRVNVNISKDTCLLSSSTDTLTPLNRCLPSSSLKADEDISSTKSRYGGMIAL